MSGTKLLGIILFVVGIVCLGLGWQQSESVGDEVKHFFTGDYTEKTTWLVVGGIVATVVGLISLAIPTRRVD